ncbi:MAG: hypothetical protein NTW76_02895 [Corynebacteriales bacterium]|nr:hypothetical protein [Mycobacteriales bacterium]
MKRRLRLTWKPNSGTRTTLLCVAGLMVAGIGLAYCVHLGADRGEESEAESTSAAAMKFITPPTSTPAVPDTVGPAPVEPRASGSAAGGVTPTAISRSKMLLGTVDSLSTSEMGIHMSDGRRHRIALTDSTHYETADKAAASPLKLGDLVVVHVLIDGERMVADLVVDGRVTASRPGN